MKNTEDQEKQEMHNRIAKLLFATMVMYYKTELDNLTCKK